MRVNRKRLVTDLSRLVQIPSWEECSTIARHAVEALRAARAENVHVDKAGNVIGSLGRGGPGLLLNAHLDTVPPGDYEGDPFSGKVSAGRLLGRGSSDDKAGVAAVLEIARHLSCQTLNQRVTFALTVWEESTARGENGAYLAARNCQAARCIVLESTMASNTSMNVNIGCKGIVNFLVTVHGRAFHSAHPDKGINAVYRAARVIEAIEKSFDPVTMPRKTYTVWNSQVEMSALATVTEVEARQGVNVIPGRCEIAVNCRLLPDGDATKLRSRMDRLVSELPRGWVSWRAEREILGHVCEDRKLVAACRAAVRAAGLKARSEILHARTDSTIFHHTGGIQSVIMGPGTMGVAHTKNEHISIDHLTLGTEAVLHAVEAMAIGE